MLNRDAVTVAEGSRATTREVPIVPAKGIGDARRHLVVARAPPVPRGTPPYTRAVRGVLFYKLARATGSLALAALLLFLAIESGSEGGLRRAEALERLGDHIARWLGLGELAGTSLALPHVLVGAIALLALDASLTLVEAWALHRGFWWGPWLIVALTAALVPAEVIALFARPSPARVGILTLNLAIGAIVLRRAIGQRARSYTPDRRSILR